MRLKTLLLSKIFVAGALAATAQTARVQVIHNSADAAASEVDVYLGTTKILDDFAFRTATPFIDAPAGMPIVLGVAPKTSASSADAIYTLTTTLAANSTYIIVANGLVSTTGYMPMKPFGLDVYNMGREMAANPANTDVLVVHGSTDAPTVDVRSGINTLVDDISYGDFSDDYLELPAADYKVRITTATGSSTVQTYSAPLGSLSLAGEALVVVASGFLNPAANSNGPAFGLYAALPAGGNLVALSTTDPEALARLQVMHNCADLAADSVDVYLNGDILLDNFAFRTATPFVDAPAKTALSIAVAPKTSTSVSDAIYTTSVTLDSGKRYIAVANGIVSPSGYSPAQSFRLSLYNMAREMATNPANTDVLVLHGSTDAPTVDIRNGSNVLVNDISFGDYSNGYLELPVRDYVVTVTDASGATTVQKYLAPLNSLDLGGEALTVLASGFVNRASNSNGPGFGLYAVSAEGGEFTALPIATNVAAVNAANKGLSIYPNPATDRIRIAGAGNDARVSIVDVTGREVMRLNNLSGDIDISNLKAGIYTIRISNEQGVSHIKMMKH